MQAVSKFSCTLLSHNESFLSLGVCFVYHTYYKIFSYYVLHFLFSIWEEFINSPVAFLLDSCLPKPLEVLNSLFCMCLCCIKILCLYGSCCHLISSLFLWIDIPFYIHVWKRLYFHRALFWKSRLYEGMNRIISWVIGFFFQQNWK